MPSCSVNGCSVTSGNKDGYKLHSFPLGNKELKLQWITNLNRGDAWWPTANSRVCSRHFVQRRPTKMFPYPVLNMSAPASSTRRQQATTNERFLGRQFDAQATQTVNSAVEYDPDPSITIEKEEKTFPRTTSVSVFAETDALFRLDQPKEEAEDESYKIQVQEASSGSQVDLCITRDSRATLNANVDWPTSSQPIKMEETLDDDSSASCEKKFKISTSEVQRAIYVEQKPEVANNQPNCNDLKTFSDSTTNSAVAPVLQKECQDAESSARPLSLGRPVIVDCFSVKALPSSTDHGYVNNSKPFITVITMPQLNLNKRKLNRLQADIEKPEPGEWKNLPGAGEGIKTMHSIRTNVPPNRVWQVVHNEMKRTGQSTTVQRKSVSIRQLVEHTDFTKGQDKQRLKAQDKPLERLFPADVNGTNSTDVIQKNDQPSNLDWRSVTVSTLMQSLKTEIDKQATTLEREHEMICPKGRCHCSKIDLMAFFKKNAWSDESKKLLFQIAGKQLALMWTVTSIADKTVALTTFLEQEILPLWRPGWVTRLEIIWQCKNIFALTQYELNRNFGIISQSHPLSKIQFENGICKLIEHNTTTRYSRGEYRRISETIKNQQWSK